MEEENHDYSNRHQRIIKRRRSLCGIFDQLDASSSRDENIEHKEAVFLSRKGTMKRSRSMSQIQASNEESNAASSNSSSNHQSIPSLSNPSLDDSTLPFKSDLFRESSILAPATQFPNPNDTKSSNSNNSGYLEHHSHQNGDPKQNQGSSLFGAVMKNIHHPNVSTPAKKINKFAVSPGGFQLQNLISGLGDSPFCIKTPGKKMSASSKLSTPSSQASSTMTTTPRRDIDWHECPITSRQLGVLDWTLKQSLEFQFQPSCSMLLENTTSPSMESMKEFLMGFDDHKHDMNNESNEDDFVVPNVPPIVDWNASLLFWQHPAIHPLPREFMNNERPSKDTISLAETSNTTGDNSRSSSSQWMSSMPPPRKIKQPPPAFTSVTVPSTKRQMLDSKSIWSIRKNEWQESFRSLYFIWLDRIRVLNGNIQQHRQKVQSHEIADTYFYACGKGHTILFRARVDKLHDGDLHIVPEILLSSSTLSLREKLRSMDAKLWLLERWDNQTGEFDESALQISAGFHATNKENGDESPNIKAELMALRRAHALGETVGADVSVSLKARKTNFWSTRTTKQIPPLFLKGIDDCATFFEIYLNRCGHIASMDEHLSPERWCDVPLLMCRRLGPFLHSTMKSLSVYRRNPSSSSTEGYSSIHVEGIFMPCAVRKLLCAAVNVMQFAARSEQEPAEKRNENNSVGTHNFVVQATTYEVEEKRMKIGTGTIGSESSKSFNGGKDFLCVVDGCNNLQKCHYNETLEVAVWDITRPTSLAYKLEYSVL